MVVYVLDWRLNSASLVSPAYSSIGPVVTYAPELFCTLTNTLITSPLSCMISIIVVVGIFVISKVSLAVLDSIESVIPSNVAVAVKLPTSMLSSVSVNVPSSFVILMSNPV